MQQVTNSTDSRHMGSVQNNAPSTACPAVYKVLTGRPMRSEPNTMTCRKQRKASRMAVVTPSGRGGYSSTCCNDHSRPRVGRTIGAGDTSKRSRYCNDNSL
jgi:hypothetical protein